MVRTTQGGEIFLQLQEVAVEIQAAPVQNTYYPVIDVEGPGLLDAVTMLVAAVGENLGVRITIDGVQLLDQAAAGAAGAEMEAHVSPRAAGTVAVLLAAYSDDTRPLKLPFRDTCLVEMRKTTANGAGNLTGIAFYYLKV